MILVRRKQMTLNDCGRYQQQMATSLGEIGQVVGGSLYAGNTTYSIFPTGVLQETREEKNLNLLLLEEEL